MPSLVFQNHLSTASNNILICINIGTPKDINFPTVAYNFGLSECSSVISCDYNSMLAILLNGFFLYVSGAILFLLQDYD